MPDDTHGGEAVHSHDHHNYKSVALNRLAWSLAITVAVMALEIAGGIWTNSMALISDAGHMLTHAFALAVSMFGILIARRPPCHHTTYGMLRAEVLAALVNGLFLVVVAVWIVVEAFERLLNPAPILSGHMLWIATVGLAASAASILLLHGSRRKDLNIGAVFIHMIGDAVSSVAIVAAAVVIAFTGWTWLDPAISIGIAVWIVAWAAGLLKETARVLLEMAPKGRNVHDIVHGLKEHFPAILDTHNEHVWTITQDVIVFTAHIKVDISRVPEGDANQWLDRVEQWLAEHYHVAECTIQMEPTD